MKTLRDLDFKNKKVLVRCDFNVPLSDQGNILDDFRIRKAIPTIEYLRKKKAKIILMSHLGRPLKNQKSNSPLFTHSEYQKFSLRPIALRLEELTREKIKFLPDCIGSEVKEETEKMKAGEIILLENLRFHKEEEKGELRFAKELSKLADIYINDAFGTCHRAHASIVGVPKYLPSAIGLLIEKEIKILSKVLEEPWSPLVVIIGGVKIATKIKAIEQFFKKADHLLLGGEIANVFLRVKRVYLRKVLPGKEIIKKIEKISLTDPKLHLPIDAVISLENIEEGIKEGYFREAALGQVRKEEGVYDIGPETIKIFSKVIAEAKMIVWNGSLGVYEKKLFERGTKEIARAIVRNYAAFKIVGGGDTVSSLSKFGLRDRFDHVSTGGGVMLDFLSGEKIIGLEALKNAGGN